MNWRIKIAFFVFIFSACGSDKVGGAESIILVESTGKMNYLIEIEEFKEMATRPNSKIVDFRKKEDYKRSFICLEDRY